jgi:hypothetical protein
MIHQNGKFATFAIVGIVAAVFGFSLYVLLTTENTIIIVNEAANAPKEVVVAPAAQEGEPRPTEVGRAVNPRVEILDTGVGFLNVRDGSSSSAKKVGTVKPGEVYEYTEVKDNWYHIVYPTLKVAWIFGQYAKIVDRSTDLFGQ